MITNLKNLGVKLEQKQGRWSGRYFLPAVWNNFGFKDYTSVPERPGEISVDPAQFFGAAIRYIMAQARNRVVQSAHKEPSPPEQKRVGAKIMYGAFLRTLTAWDHYPGGSVEPGSFLKTIVLLPFLHSLGVERLYLLPIFAGGEKYKKGELASPYAVKNFYQLDPTLHDPLLGEATPSLLEAEFKALVEACHLLGIQVMVDFVFRTASRDNDLIIKHPQWFYWLDLEQAAAFVPPVVKRVKNLSSRNENKVELLYKSTAIKEYLTYFRPAPNLIDPEKWELLCKRQQQSGENILDLVENEFGITTTPGFSDVICDPQPPWTDVTYLRFYFDIHPRARKYVDAEQPPYVLQDVACLNLYRGDNPNRELWEYIINIIPYYQQKFGINGARIDMGHALPPGLNQAIIERTRALDPNFLFWAEEFDFKNGAAAKAYGYDFITGDLWQLYKTVKKKGFCRHLFTRVRSAALPLTGALELPDTPRAARYYPDKTFLELVVLLNYFLPNVVPFINNGMELLENQPMNLGLDNTEVGRYVLPPTDPMYGKLAFFDHYRLHWLQEDSTFMVPLLRTAAELRRRFCHLIKTAFLIKDCGHFPHKSVLYFAYEDAKRGELLLFVASHESAKPVEVSFERLVPVTIQAKFPGITLVYASRKVSNLPWSWRQKRWLEPGEVIIAVGREAEKLYGPGLSPT